MTSPGKTLKKHIWHRPAVAWSLALLIVCLCAMFLGGFLPVHDAIGWEGIHRFFSSNIRDWHIPFWNKFSQGGTPFYPYYQSLGLIEPLNLGITITLKALGIPIGYNYVLTYLLLILFTTFTSYLVIEHLLGDGLVGITFATIQFIVLLPVYIRQNGIVTPFLYMPSLTLLWMLFLETPSGPRKASLLIMGASVLGFAVNLYLPSYIAFYFAGLVILSLIFNKEQREDCRRFLAGSQGRMALFAAGCIFLCLAAPMLAQLWDLRHNTELIPTVRIFQKNDNILANIYASDLVGNFFAVRSAVSTTLFTLLGIIVEPLKLANPGYEYYSEIIIYIGCIPLLCAAYAVKNGKQPYVKVFSGLAAVLILTSCSLGFRGSPNESAFQKLMSIIFPLLQPVEIFQNFGAAATFCLIILAAAGFKETLKNKDSSPFVLGLNLLAVKSFISLNAVSSQINKMAAFMEHFGSLAAVIGLVCCILGSVVLFDRIIVFVNKNIFESKPVYHPLYLLKYTLPVMLTIAFTRSILMVPFERFFLINIFCACLFMIPAYLEFRAVKDKAQVAKVPLFPETRHIVIIAAVCATAAELILFNFINLRNMGYFLFPTRGVMEQAYPMFILSLSSYLVFAIYTTEKKRLLYHFFVASHVMLTTFFICAYPLGQQTRVFGWLISNYGRIAGTICLLLACASSIFAFNFLALLSSKYLEKHGSAFSVSPTLYLLKLPAIFLLAIAFGSSIYPMLTANRKPIFLFAALLSTALYLESGRIKSCFRNVSFSYLGRSETITILTIVLFMPIYWAVLSWPILPKGECWFLGERHFNWVTENGLLKEIPYKATSYRIPFEDKYPAGFNSFWGMDTLKKEKNLYTFVVAKELAKVRVYGREKYRTSKSANGWEFYKNNFSHPLYPARAVPDFTEKGLLKKDIICFRKLMETAVTFARLWDSFYMTRYYYDFVVNVRLPRQLYAGGILNPIVDFFPAAKTITAANKYEATAHINGLPESSIGDTLVIESNKTAGRFDAKITDFFDKEKEYRFTPDDLENYFDNLQLPRKPVPDFIETIEDSGDRVVFRINAPKDGFLYYSDGYSKYWHANLDGQPVEIQKANIAFKAVQVLEGVHVIEFYYSYGLLQAAFYSFLLGICFFFISMGFYFGPTLLSKNR